MNEICIYNNNNLQIFGTIEKKTLHIKIAVNDLYNTKLCGSNTV